MTLPRHPDAPETPEVTAARLKRMAQHREFQAHVARVMSVAVKLKQRMQERGLKRARANCPRCGVKGALQASIAGKRHHMRMWCDTPSCSMEMME